MQQTTSRRPSEVDKKNPTTHALSVKTSSGLTPPQKQKNKNRRIHIIPGIIYMFMYKKQSNTQTKNGKQKKFENHATEVVFQTEEFRKTNRRKYAPQQPDRDAPINSITWYTIRNLIISKLFTKNNFAAGPRAKRPRLCGAKKKKKVHMIHTIDLFLAAVEFCCTIPSDYVSNVWVFLL